MMDMVLFDAASTKQRLCLDYSFRWSYCCRFLCGISIFGERGRFIISGGANDKSVKLWAWFKYVDQDQTSRSSCDEIFHLAINLKKKLSKGNSTTISSKGES